MLSPKNIRTIIKSKKHPNNINLSKYYKSYRNKLKQILKIANIKFHKDQFKSVFGNSKNTWKLTNKSNYDKDKIKHLIYNSKLINAKKEPETASNKLNTYFSTIG